MTWNNLPFLLKPCGKDYLWGGEKLKTRYHKAIDLPVLAETWECSAHPDGVSVVSGGIHDGLPLDQVLAEHPEYLGSHPDRQNGLPILVKLIDAREKLSVQVHPDDAYAAIHEEGSLGKTEMWYVLEAEQGAELTFGFARTVDREILQHALDSDSIEKYLNRVPIKKDDVFYVKAGTVHGIGAGAVIAEIQENSNLTYRLYDYNRLDREGNLRELHVEKAFAVADMQAVGRPRQPMRILKYTPGCASEFLCRCKYFQVERLLLNTSERRINVPYRTDETSFEVLLCIEGEGTLNNGSEDLVFRKGDCIFVPSQSTQLCLTGKAQLLKIHC